MAGTITYDHVGSQYTAGADGNRWSRRFLIRGMTAGPSIPHLIEEAFALIPDTGTPAPAPIGNMSLRNATLERIWCDQDAKAQGQDLWNADGVIVYTTPTRAGGTLGTPDDNGAGVIVASTSVVEEIETDRDRDGTQIVTEYDNALQAHLLRGFVIGRTRTFRRLEVSSPRARQDTHEGTLNNAIWNGYAAETVLLQTLNWETDDDGASYLCDYTFVVRPAGWKTRVVHEDPFWPGNPLPFPTGAAVQDVDLISTSNFAALNIVLP